MDIIKHKHTQTRTHVSIETFTQPLKVQHSNKINIKYTRHVCLLNLNIAQPFHEMRMQEKLIYYQRKFVFRFFFCFAALLFRLQKKVSNSLQKLFYRKNEHLYIKVDVLRIYIQISRYIRHISYVHNSAAFNPLLLV